MPATLEAPVPTKKSSELTLRDILSRLTYRDAVALLGEEGPRLIRDGGKFEIRIDDQVELSDARLSLSLGEATATIALESAARRRLYFECSRCSRACEHVGAAFALVLEEKTPLGLAVPPSHPDAVESLTDAELVRLAIEERAERAKVEKMLLESMDPSTPWTDYTVTNAASGKTYRVALRGRARGDSYCSCPDFRKNTLGTCKHLIFTLAKVKRRFTEAQLSAPYRSKHLAIHLRYGETIELRIALPRIHDPEVKRIVQPLRDRAVEDVHDLVRRMRRLEAAGREVVVYPDAEEFIQQWLYRDRIRKLVEEIRRDPARHPLRKELLAVELLPYQLDGIAFAAGSGRAILADDMGLGKTIQAVGVAEILAREAGVKKVLIVCPASIKAQWRAEITRFSGRSSQLVVGSASERRAQYASDCFFTISNYEQVLRDILAVEDVKWDLIVLDEAQRIKNWEAKTARVIKGLRSPFALALSGTPLENRLDELFSVVEFIDERRLGPAFRFFNTHRIVDERGKVLGYRNLGELREKLKPVLLRRTRAAVMKDLPPRTTEIVRIEPTAEQADMHRSWMQVVSTIVRKKFLTEMDLLRLQKALLACRRVANSTFLVDRKPPGYSTKLERLDELLAELAAEEDRKIVLFSEWTTMLDIVQPLLRKRRLEFVRLDGSVPQKQRQSLVHEFQVRPQCRVFVATNAGSTGLNLQAANTVVNVDLPWNPAILEQRIGRVHRMGQKRAVQVFLLVTEGTIEENLLGTLSAKHELAMASLDLDSQVEEVGLQSNVEELRRRLELLLGARPEAPVDESEKRRHEAEIRRLARKERVAVAGGQLLSSAFEFLRSMLPETEESGEAARAAVFLEKCFEDCVGTDGEGRPTLTVTLPDRAALASLTRSLAGIVAASGAVPVVSAATGRRGANGSGPACN